MLDNNLYVRSQINQANNHYNIKLINFFCPGKSRDFPGQSSKYPAIPGQTKPPETRNTSGYCSCAGYPPL